MAWSRNGGGARTYGVTVSEAERVPLRLAVMFIVLVDRTDLVDTVKVAVVEPAGTTTLAGTVATVVLLLKVVTLAPPVGAGPLIVMVPVDGVPPRTDVGFREREMTPGVFTRRVTERVRLL